MKLTYTVEEVADLLGVSRSAAYAAAARGELPTIRIGRRVLIKRATFDGLFTPSAAEVEEHENAGDND